MAANKPKTKTDAEQQRLKREERARRTRRRNRQLLGAALSVLILVGASSIVARGVSLVADLMKGEDDTGRYRDMFQPFVWFDVLPFSALEQADANTLKQSVIWSILNREGAVLERNARGEPLIPAARVDQYAADLFGPSFRFAEHATFTDEVQQLTYTYSAETQMYSAPSTGLMPIFQATVTEVVRQPGGERRVVMGYVSTMAGDQLVADLDFDHPAKYMDYLMRREGSDYYLYAIVPNTTHTPTAESQPSSRPAGAVLAPGSQALPPASSGPQSAASPPAGSDGESA